MRTVRVGNTLVGGGKTPVLIAGPCVIEDRDSTLKTAVELARICSKLDIPLVFKASYDKANRTSLNSFRGPGIDEGLKVLSDVRAETGVPVTSDVHDGRQVPAAAEILDLIQVPAFLCRQTDLLTAAAGTGKPLNVKKGQFLAPWDVKGIIGKVSGPGNLLISERGTTFGYNNLVVDYRSFPMIRELGVPVIYDATHSLQLPGGMGSSSGGQRQYVPHLCRAAAACGVDGLFMEVHSDPDRAPCDGPNMWPLGQLEGLLEEVMAIHRAGKREER